MEIKPVTEEEKRRFVEFTAENPLICHELPVRLPSGFKVTEYFPECASCGHDIPPSSAWVKRDLIEFSQKSVETWTVMGFCRGCATITSCFLRFHSGGHFDTIVGHEWRHGVLNDPPARGEQIRRWIKALFGKL